MVEEGLRLEPHSTNGVEQHRAKKCFPFVITDAQQHAFSIFQQSQFVPKYFNLSSAIQRIPASVPDDHRAIDE